MSPHLHYKIARAHQHEIAAPIKAVTAIATTRSAFAVRSARASAERPLVSASASRPRRR